MKLQALEKSLATALEQARILASDAEKSGLSARVAKNEARQAKARLKLAKQKAKNARRAAKEAKRAFAQALCASEKAAAQAASLEESIRAERRKAQQPVAERRPAKSPSAHAPGKPPTRGAKASRAKQPGKVAIPATPAKSAAKPVNWDRAIAESNIQVPRDLPSKPAPVAGGNPPPSSASPAPNADTSKSSPAGSE